MTEGDDEDLYLRCLEMVMQRHQDGGTKAKYPQVAELADEARFLYSQVKVATAKQMKEKPKLVTQLK